jgi:hypothetical protein
MIPIAPQLVAILESIQPRISKDLVAKTSLGEPWKDSGLLQAFRSAQKKAVLEGFRFHDQRAPPGTRWRGFVLRNPAEVGAPPPCRTSRPGTRHGVHGVGVADGVGARGLGVVGELYVAVGVEPGEARGPKWGRTRTAPPVVSEHPFVEVGRPHVAVGRDAPPGGCVLDLALARTAASWGCTATGPCSVRAIACLGRDGVRCGFALLCNVASDVSPCVAGADRTQHEAGAP